MYIFDIYPTGLLERIQAEESVQKKDEFASEKCGFYCEGNALPLAETSVSYFKILS